MGSNGDCLRRLYDAFNAKDLEGLLSLVHPEVEWDGELEGLVRGRDGMRLFLQRHWPFYDTDAQPIASHREADGRIRVDVRLVARDKDGNVMISKVATHRVRFVDGLVRNFDVTPLHGSKR